MLANPKVSVVLPSRDRPAEVRRAVASVLAQTFTDWELVVIDDGSASAARLEDLEQLDWRVTVMRNDEPEGVARARNRGVGSARGEWIAFLDDDDVWHPSKLEVQLARARDTGASFVYTAATVIDGDRRVYVQSAVPDDVYARMLTRDSIVRSPSTVLVRRDNLIAVGGFDSRLSVVADWELWLRLCPDALVASVPEPLTGIIEHPGSMQLTMVDRIGAELELVAARHPAAQDARAIRRWRAQKQWTAQRTARHAASYAWEALRCHGVRGTIRQAFRHWQWGHVTAPDWVQSQVDAAQHRTDHRGVRDPLDDRLHRAAVG